MAGYCPGKQLLRTTHPKTYENTGTTLCPFFLVPTGYATKGRTRGVVSVIAGSDPLVWGCPSSGQLGYPAICAHLLPHAGPWPPRCRCCCGYPTSGANFLQLSRCFHASPSTKYEKTKNSRKGFPPIIGSSLRFILT
jgi:hypothetical protein